MSDERPSKRALVSAEYTSAASPHVAAAAEGILAISETAASYAPDSSLEGRDVVLELSTDSLDAPPFASHTQSHGLSHTQSHGLSHTQSHGLSHTQSHGLSHDNGDVNGQSNETNAAHQMVDALSLVTDAVAAELNASADVDVSVVVALDADNRANPHAAKQTSTSNAIAYHGPIDWRIAAQQLRKQLSSLHRPDAVVGLDSQMQQLHASIQAMLERDESNATLLLGFRGSGKSLVLQSCVDDLKQKFDFSCVYLNGCIQKTDKLALREIVQQLYPDPQQRRGIPVIDIQEMFYQHLLSGKHTVLILDEFDMFTQKSRQSFLYNILDALQADTIKLSIVGLSCRMDVLDLLEKRVRSRFSNSVITFYSNLGVEQIISILASRLMLPSYMNDDFAQQFNQATEAFLRDPIVKDFIYKKYEVTRDVRAFLQMMTLTVANLSSTRQYLSRMCLPHSFYTTDSKNLMVQGLSILELCLLISMKKMEEEGTDFYNFEMIYITYKKFATGTNNLVDLFPKNVAFKAFEHLAKLELIRLDHTNHHLKEFQEASLLIEPSQIVEALMKFRDCPVTVKQWGCH
eukprot:TRINITY_DN534_c0_g1_i1.p1 TRINITY_DN534_c0_g1~~TRINITY_DN534_c0_g1_i1.p1  ORF type:complete len:604 (+),score=151.88 TRINITY_DN534_c0_g1_i1:91-1812(+)